MNMFTLPRAILFDWHATLVDTHEAGYHAMDDVLLKFGELGLLDRLTKPDRSKTEEDAKLVEYVRENLKLHPKVNQLRAVLGLDAKNAAIITSKADIPLAVKEVLTGSLSFNGQRCTALKIVWAQQTIADEFIKQFNTALEELKFGLPWEEGVSLIDLFFTKTLTHCPCMTANMNEYLLP